MLKALFSCWVKKADRLAAVRLLVLQEGFRTFSAETALRKPDC